MEANVKEGDASFRTDHVSDQATRKTEESNAAQVASKAWAASLNKSKRQMNKWESEYAQELEMQRRVGAVQWFEYEPFRLRLTANTGYTPDFAAVEHGILRFIEVKGFLRDDANIKFKMAAELFPFEFIMLRKKRVSEGGGWEVVKHLNKAVW